MNFFNKQLAILLLSAISIVSQAQVQKVWTKDLGNTINWQKVSSFGHYIIGTNNGIQCINPESGEILWTNDTFNNLTPDHIAQVGNSPLFSINTGDEVHMIDPYTGKVKFNSQQSGILDINDQEILYKANGILISGKTAGNKDKILFSSLESGKVAWEINDDYGRLISANEINDQEVLIVTLYYNYRINTKTGKVVWKNNISEVNQQLEKLGALGAMMKQAASQQAQSMEINVTFHQHPNKDIFYIGVEKEGSTGFTSSNGGLPPMQTEYNAYNLSDGSKYWEKPLMVNGRMGVIAFHGDDLIVMPNDPGNSKINLYDHETQEGKWGKKGNGIKIKGGIYTFIDVKDGLLLVSKNVNEKNYIYYLDTNQGILTFDKPVKIDGELVFGEPIKNGLLYATDQEVNILNIVDGSLLLSNAINTNPNLIAENEQFLYAYDIRDRIVKVLDKHSGVLKELSGKIEFYGKESPEYIELSENGILVTSSQNIMLINNDGNTVYHEYYEAPKEPGLMRALRYAQAVRAAYIGALSYTASAAFTSAAQQAGAGQQVEKAIAGEIGNAYGELGDQASAFATQSFKQANMRFKATKEAEKYMVILSRIEKNNYLLKVDKQTGQITGKIDLGNDRNPRYEMDGVTGFVYYQSDTNKIDTYKL
ncbi:outer membrane protein assembly factor BamB family protein [Marinigracilibium pacificum]|uniref:PQQ-binding-like beta-propeller repeat protein n=1 Tax=Marinigracilibium pacificum TaxID=2729599 RepID=A0A848J2W7_9BACT|nr:PQQ-binding-like beta-propeller repeat protein [Marinigracilibium pacificum]NMM50071.1 PQQ-binding-like beta-propeller repeat protein [Marinigracilibium pacificum]